MAAQRAVALGLMAGLAGSPALAGPAITEMPFWPHYGGARKPVLLDGTWRYGVHLDPSRPSFRMDSMDPHFDPTIESLAPNTTTVPSTMDVAMPGVPGVRGVAIYKTSFEQSGPARLQFFACSFYCRVFVDGKDIGDHKSGGYVPFFLDIPEPQQGSIGAPVKRELVVLADNRFNATTAPMHTGGDFWHYGGLMRSIVLHNMPAKGETWVWRAYVFPKCIKKGLVDIQVVLTDSKASGEVDVTIAWDGANAEQTVKAKAVDGVAWINDTSVPNPRLWSLEAPQLHNVSVTVGESTVVERFGLRIWGVDKRKDSARITLNGEVLKLHGWNHHTQWPDTGATPTKQQMEEDLALLKEAGANYIRGAHYPQDQRWLDRLDETGFAMWEETLGPGTKVANFQDWDFFMKYQLLQMDEMMDASLNHASIMTWGFFNEGQSHHEEACPAYAACAQRAKSRDPTRFQTWASNRLVHDKCLEHASMISFNHYPGWYQDLGNVTAVKAFWAHMSDYVRDNFASTPWTISETGAGGLYEWDKNETAVKWTQKYQTEIIAGDVEQALADDRCAGIALWHFFDFKANDDATAKCGPCDYLEGVEPPTCGFIDATCGRPGGQNHKGVVDFYRRKKEPFAVVAKKYKEVGLPQAIVI